MTAAIPTVIAAVLLVAFAGLRTHYEEVAKERLETRRKLRLLTGRWQNDILKLIEGFEDIDVGHDDTSYMYEQYRMCSNLLELSADLWWPHRKGLHSASLLLFGRETVTMAERIPANSISRADANRIAVSIMKRGWSSPTQTTGPRIYITHRGLVGDLFGTHRHARRSGFVYRDVTQLPVDYNEDELVSAISVAGHIKWYHVITLSPQYREWQKDKSLYIRNAMKGKKARNAEIMRELQNLPGDEAAP